LVWELARWRNSEALRHGELEPIPESSIVKPPSAELRPGQTDQDSLPPYDVLDPVLEAYVERAMGRSELLEAGFDPAVVDHIVSTAPGRTGECRVPNILMAPVVYEPASRRRPRFASMSQFSLQFGSREGQ